MEEQKQNLRVKIYTLDEVKSRLTGAGMPVGTSVTENDEIRKEITDQFVQYVEDSYWHTNYDKENGKIVAQVNRFTAALQLKEWGAEEAKDKKDERDNLVNKNKLLRTQLGLANLDPHGTKQDEYALDPFVEPRIKQAMDHDEARACGGTCHSEDPNLAYHIVDLAAVLGAGGYNVADISKQQYEKWKDQLKDLLRNQDVGDVRILMQEEKDARAATVAAVTAFVSNWNTAGGTRAGILTLKQMLLSQRLIERQIANLKAVNADFNEEIKHRAGDDLGGASDEKGVF